MFFKVTIRNANTGVEGMFLQVFSIVGYHNGVHSKFYRHRKYTCKSVALTHYIKAYETEITTYFVFSN